MSKTTKRALGVTKPQDSFLEQIAPESHFHRVFDGLPNIHFFAKNLAGETMFFSKGLPAHHGIIDDSEMIGKTDLELTPGPLAEQYLDDDRKVISTGEPRLNIVELWLDEVGLPDWFVTNKFPIKDWKGNVIGVMGTIQALKGQVPPDIASSSIQPAVQILRSRLSIFPSMKTLAESCIQSPRQLQRIFQQTFRMSPRTYWMKCRIRSACDSLRSTDESILLIANRLGFCDQSNFTAHFRKHTGITPQIFRKANARTMAD